MVCDGAGMPLVMLLTEGQMSDHKGARLMLKALPEAKAMIAYRGYDSDWFREALASRGTEPCIPPKKKTGRNRWITTRRSTASATRSRTSSPNSKTGGASPHATTDAPTPSSRPSASQPPSPSISIDLPLNFHPAAFRVLPVDTPEGANGATGDRRSWSGLRSRSPVAVSLAAKAAGVA